MSLYQYFRSETPSFPTPEATGIRQQAKSKAKRAIQQATQEVESHTYPSNTFKWHLHDIVFIGKNGYLLTV